MKNKAPHSNSAENPNICYDTLKKAVLISFERIDQEPKHLERILEDIITEFRLMDTKRITQAIRMGSLGKFGLTYKLNCQVFCIWIREYLKSKNNKGI